MQSVIEVGVKIPPFRLALQGDVPSEREIDHETDLVLWLGLIFALIVITHDQEGDLHLTWVSFHFSRVRYQHICCVDLLQTLVVLHVRCCSGSS